MYRYARCVASNSRRPTPGTSGNIRFVGVGSVMGGRISFSTRICIPRRCCSGLPVRHGPRGRSILCAVINSFNVPDCIRASRLFYFRHGVTLLRPGGSVRPEFLCCDLGGPTFCGKIRVMTGKSTRGLVPLDGLGSLGVLIPSGRTRHRVTSVLSTCSSLVRGGRERVGLLRRTTRQLCGR